MSRKQTTNKGWIILAPMGKDFNGKRVWIPSMGYSYVPRLYDTKGEAIRNKTRGEVAVQATVTTEWEDVT